MKDSDRTREQLTAELSGLRQRIAELEASEAEYKQAEKVARDLNDVARGLAEIVEQYRL